MKKILTCLFLLILLSSDGLAQQAAPDSLAIYFAQGGEKVNAGDWVGATANYYAAQRIAEARQDVRALCQIQSGMGKMFAASENDAGLQQAITSGFAYCRACKDSSTLAKMLMFQGILSYKLQQLDSSAECFQQSSELYFLLRDTIRSANALAKVGNVREEQGRYQEALGYYLRYYETVMQQPDDFYRLTANIYLGGNYLYLNRPQDALRHALEARLLAQKLKANFEYSVTLEYEAGAYQQMGLYEKAFITQKQYTKFYKDTLINAERTEQIETLKTQYETEKKEGQIALQTAQLSVQQRTIWAVALALGIAVLGGALLFRLTRRLRQRNAEKEFLIKEIHHRVKNNLQVLSSLLHLQSRQITDETALDAVREGQNRVDAMGLIHQKLYMGDNLAAVEMQDYLKNLGDTLLDSFGLDDDRVKINYSVTPLHLDVDTAIPLGLIINELVANSLKYAFPNRQSGTVEISLWKDDASKLCLKVADDGAGKNAAPDLKKSTAFGTQLVQMLSKKLGGKPEVTASEQGYETLIRFENFKEA